MPASWAGRPSSARAGATGLCVTVTWAGGAPTSACRRRPEALILDLGVVARAAVERVGPGVAVQQVVSIAAEEDVVPAAAK
jgi:hypothetical protein